MFSGENYLANWVQALFRSLGSEKTKGATLGLGGDGRYFNKEAAQIILKSAAAAGFARVVVGKGEKIVFCVWVGDLCVKREKGTREEKSLIQKNSPLFSSFALSMF